MIEAPTGCASCPIGRASGVGRGSYCAFADQRFRAGEHLYREGEPTTHTWFVKRGTVALFRRRGGRPAVRAVRFAGALIGLETLVSPVCSDSARATTAVIACGISRAELDVWLGPADAPARTCLEVALRGERADRLRRQPTDGPAVARVADWLGQEGPRGVSLTLPRQLVAEMLGMRPETLSRALATLRQRGAIAADRTSIEIIDEERLAKAARPALHGRQLV